MLFNCCMVWSDVSLIVTGLGVLTQHWCLHFLSVWKAPWSFSVASLSNFNFSTIPCCQHLAYNLYILSSSCAIFFFAPCSFPVSFLVSPSPQHLTSSLLVLLFTLFFFFSPYQQLKFLAFCSLMQGLQGGCSGTALSHATITTGRIQYVLRLLE